MDELDQLLQDLSAPKPQEVPKVETPTPTPVEPVKAELAPVPQPQTANFSELDDLMNELGEAPKPQQATTSSTGNELDDLMADLAGGTPAEKPRESAAIQTAGNAVDDLLAELSAPVQTQQPKPAANNPADDLDSVMNELQGLSTKPAPAASQSTAAPNRKNELDNILNSLNSEMTEIGVDSQFKGQCAHCNKPILGQVVTALGKTWHVEHFACKQCRKGLGTSSFFEKDGQPYCEKCFQDLHSQKCAYCDGPIRDRCINALGKSWHPDHFFCSQCGKLFSGGGFMEKDGKAYCEEDFFNMFAPKCGGCEKAIMSDCITALGRQWHPTCFVCQTCKKNFDDGAFFEHEGKPYCEKHFHEQKGSLCAACQKPVVGRCVTALNKKFHPEHFTCAFCMKQLSKGTFKENSGKAYCQGCHIKLFG